MKYRDYMQLQMEEIRRHKWIESEKAGRDLGQSAVFDWIQNYSHLYRNYITKELGEKIEVGNS